MYVGEFKMNLNLVGNMEVWSISEGGEGEGMGINCVWLLP